VNIAADIEVFLSRISQLVNLKTTVVNRLPLLRQAVDETIVVEFLEMLISANSSGLAARALGSFPK
jgi:hypothetical protein